MIKIAGLIILIVGILSGVYLLTSGNLKLFSKAAEVTFNEFPQDVIISNVTDISFSLSFYTPKKPTTPKVYFGTNKENLTTEGSSDRGNTPGYTHHFTLRNLSPGTLYYVYIVSGDENYPKDSFFKQSTAPNLQGGSQSDVHFFGAAEGTNSKAATDAIAYLRTEKGQLLSRQVDSRGGWRFDFTNYRTKDLSAFYTMQQVDKAEILFLSGLQGVGYLETFGFKNLPTKVTLENTRVPFYKIQLGPVDFNSPQTGTNNAANGSDNQGGNSFFDIIWISIKSFFGFK